jgi:hypothetical protein
MIFFIERALLGGLEILKKFKMRIAEVFARGCAQSAGRKAQGVRRVTQLTACARPHAPCAFPLVAEGIFYGSGNLCNPVFFQVVEEGQRNSSFRYFFRNGHVTVFPAQGLVMGLKMNRGKIIGTANALFSQVF